MKKALTLRRSWILLVALLVALSLLFASTRQRRRIEDGTGERRLAPVLERVLQWRQGPAVPVIVRVRTDVFEADWQARQLEGRSSHNMLESVGAYRAQLRPEQLQMLLRSDWVEYITLDPPVRTSESRAEREGSTLTDFLKIIGSYYTRVKGDEGAIVVFDSGIQPHADLDSPRIRMDFTSGRAVRVRVDDDDLEDEDEDEDEDRKSPDEYGHGTHVAGIIAGEGKKSGGRNRGVSQADLIDIRVINGEGWGVTSNLIKAIDWAIANRDRYDIRIANLSLGHPPLESYRDDPLCAAVRRMVEAGIVTVVSAGNLGKTNGHPRIYGGITSPGIEPSVITVGAINNSGTLSHLDDLATSYSSRGPTIDGLFKPDISAPGNSIPSTAAKGSKLTLKGADSTADEYYLTLSGSSMATAFVTGTVALMLDENEALTPHVVKTILMLTAAKLPLPHLFEQGNGMVNALAAVQMAKNVDVRKRKLKRDIDPYWLLPLQEDVNCRRDPDYCERIWVGGALAYADTVLFSPLVSAPSLKLWGSSVVWADQLSWEKDPKLSWGGGFFDSRSRIWQDASFWSDGFIWADSSLARAGILGADGFIWTDGFFWVDGSFWSDALLPSATELSADEVRGDP